MSLGFIFPHPPEDETNKKTLKGWSGCAIECLRSHASGDGDCKIFYLIIVRTSAVSSTDSVQLLVLGARKILRICFTVYRGRTLR